jgi:hypothetical protein
MVVRVACISTVKNSFKKVDLMEEMVVAVVTSSCGETNNCGLCFTSSTAST